MILKEGCYLYMYLSVTNLWKGVSCTCNISNPYGRVFIVLMYVSDPYGRAFIMLVFK